MDRNELIRTAQNLKQVSENSAIEYTMKKDGMVALINLMMENRADLFEMIGLGNNNLMKDHHANHARFLESIFIQLSPEVMVDTMIWEFRVYTTRNFKLSYWFAQLDTWIEICTEQLSIGSFQEVYPYYEWLQANIETFYRLSKNDREVSLTEDE